MLTENPISAHPQIVSDPLSLKDLAAVLVRHYGLHEGLFDVMVEYQIAVGGFGPDPANPLPGAMMGAHRIGLIRTEQPSGRTVDAALINPEIKKAKAKTPALKKTAVKRTKKIESK